MQETSDLYKQIYLSQDYYVETSVAIGESGRLITEKAEVILFGGTGILISSGGGDGGYDESMLLSVRTTKRVFKDNVPEVGCCPCGEIDVEMIMPVGEIPQKALVSPYVRLVSNETGEKSEWIRKGLFYIDTRTNTHNDDDLDILTIHGYDAMIKADILYPSTTLSFPARDIDVVRDIASKMGVGIEQRTFEIINKGYRIQFPAQYTMREVLGFIGGMYAGNWVMNDVGDLQFIGINDLLQETSLLIDEVGYYITFGGDRIAL